MNKKMWYIYTVEYYSVIKKEQNNAFAATWMQLEIIILNKESQKEKDKYGIEWSNMNPCFLKTKKKW